MSTPTVVRCCGRLVVLPCEGDYLHKVRPTAAYPYADAPELRTISPFPVVLPDGSVTPAGFDAASGVLTRSDLAARVPAAPTAAEVQAASDAVLALVAGQQFRTPADRSAWLAVLVTLVARPAIGGNVPAFSFQNAVYGERKLFYAQATHAALFGDRLAGIRIHKDSDAKWALTAWLSEGRPALFLPFDAGRASKTWREYATCSRWKVGVRGVGKIDVVPSTVILRHHAKPWPADSAESFVLPIRTLGPVGEGGDRIDHAMLKTCLADHQRITVDLLTIARAYILAGKPTFDLPPWPAFPAFDFVRNLLVWLGLPDPIATRAELTAPTSAPKRKARTAAR